MIIVAHLKIYFLYLLFIEGNVDIFCGALFMIYRFVHILNIKIQFNQKMYNTTKIALPKSIIHWGQTIHPVFFSYINLFVFYKHIEVSMIIIIKDYLISLLSNWRPQTLMRRNFFANMCIRMLYNLYTLPVMY